LIPKVVAKVGPQKISSNLELKDRISHTPDRYTCCLLYMVLLIYLWPHILYFSFHCSIIGPHASELDLRIQSCVLCARVSVCLSVTRDLRNRSMDHSEILGDVRGQKSNNYHTAALLKKILVFSKTAHLC
jgi:hypothetical protein